MMLTTLANAAAWVCGVTCSKGSAEERRDQRALRRLLGSGEQCWVDISC